MKSTISSVLGLYDFFVLDPQLDLFISGNHRSASTSVSQRYVSEDPDVRDPYQHVTDPQHWFRISRPVLTLQHRYDTVSAAYSRKRRDYLLSSQMMRHTPCLWLFSATFHLEFQVSEGLFVLSSMAHPPSPIPLSAPPLLRGRTDSAGGKGDWGSIF
jgi:hypothetical protein